jgi:type VI secretion system secreted protein VgrG
MRDVTVLVASPDFSCDGLEVSRLVGHERLSRLYDFEVDVVARRTSAVPAEALVGGAIRILFTSSDGAERLVAGVVASATDRLDPESDLRSYRLRVAPLAHRMTQIRLQEAFAGTVPSIVAQKLDQCDVPYELRTSHDYPYRDFVAQFGETDLEFTSRLCEHVGLSFAFESSPEGDKLVLTDDNRFPGAGPGLTIPFRGRGERLDLHLLELEARMSPSMCLVSDYNYRNPDLEIVGRFENAAGTGGGFIEYGVHARTPEEAAWLARIRGEALECQRRRVVGQSDRIELVPGREFKVDGHPFLGDPVLLVTEVVHRIERPAKGQGEGNLAYSNEFRAIPGGTPFRPERLTPVPRIPGLLGGVVLPMPGGDERTPWLDDEGRYRVQLFFDALGPTEREPASRAMRMLQAHAGPGYGTHFPLRPGTEVLLGFVNGDVDRPLIVGAAPNPTTLSPVTASTALHHRIRTATGILLEFEEGS